MTPRRFPWLAVLGSLALALVLVVGVTVVLVLDGDESDASKERRSRADELKERLLEDARAGDRPFLCHVPHQEQRRAAALADNRDGGNAERPAVDAIYRQ